MKTKQSPQRHGIHLTFRRHSSNVPEEVKVNKNVKVCDNISLTDRCALHSGARVTRADDEFENSGNPRPGWLTAKQI